MFFKKRTPKAPEPVQNRRAHYRKRISGPHRLEARLHVPGWDPLPVELLDLSAGGAGIRMSLAQDRNVKVGDRIELSIGAMMRDEILTNARVATIAPDGPSLVRYGLEFLDPPALSDQLDGLYARYFNRRRHVRVRPSLDERIPAVLRLTDDQIQTQVHDLSESGLSVVVGRETAAKLEQIEWLDVSFRLPKSADTIELRIGVRHRTHMNDQVRLGFEFDLTSSSASTSSIPAIRSYVAARETELAKWDKNSA